MPNIIGYLKPNINKQDVQLQLDQLEAAGVGKIYQETSSVKKHNTSQLDKLLAEVQEGDTIVVTSLDRIAHNPKHLLEIVQSLKASGVTFKVIDYGIDTSTIHGEIIHLLLDAIVEFERQIVKERQSLGIARAKREGRYKGRKPTAREKTDEVMALNKEGLTKQKIADELGIGVASVYRILKANTEPRKPRRKVEEKPEAMPNDKKKRVVDHTTRQANAKQLSFF